MLKKFYYSYYAEPRVEFDADSWIMAYNLDQKDVWYTPIFMKKGRPAYALSVMCREDVKDACIKVILRETSAIGMRVSLQVRVIMDREAVTVDTPYGPVDAKHLTYEDIDKTTIEYESAKKLAEANNIPLSEILK